MNTNIKKTAILLGLSVAGLLFSQCNDKEILGVPGVQTNTSFTSSKLFLESRAPQMQQFTKNTSNDILIITTNGLHFRFPQNAFKTITGAPVFGDVDIEITEYITKGEMVFSGVTTTSDNSLLESGGMFNIAVKQNGQELRLNANSYRVMIPTVGQDPEMKIFQGSFSPKDSIINWSQDSSTWIGQDTTLKDTTSFDSTYNDYYYYSLNISFLSWCNLDKYRNAPTGTKVRLKIADSINSPYLVQVYMLFNGRSVVKLPYDKLNEEWNSGSFNLPNGWNIKLIAVYVDQANKQLKYKLVNSIIVSGHLEIVSVLDIISEADLEALIKSL